MDTPNPSPSAPPEPPVARLAARVAHELNNPLDAVLRLVSLAQRKNQAGDYGDVERHLADAQFGLQRMAEILRELMDIGRQTHEAALRSQQVALAELLAQATRSVAPQAEQKHVVLALDSTVSPADNGDGPRLDLRLSQVLANLLRNAVDASPEGSMVRVAARTDVGGLAITVEDAGPGIDPALRPRLFTPFVTTKPRGQGHGLGLAISRELVLSLGGTLTLENGTAGGCVAGVWVPTQRAAK
jgi:signal transduction histidine kinase